MYHQTDARVNPFEFICAVAFVESSRVGERAGIYAPGCYSERSRLHVFDVVKIETVNGHVVVGAQLVGNKITVRHARYFGISVHVCVQNVIPVVNIEIFSALAVCDIDIIQSHVFHGIYCILVIATDDRACNIYVFSINVADRNAVYAAHRPVASFVLVESATEPYQNRGRHVVHHYIADGNVRYVCAVDRLYRYAGISSRDLCAEEITVADGYVFHVVSRLCTYLEVVGKRHYLAIADSHVLYLSDVGFEYYSVIARRNKAMLYIYVACAAYIEAVAVCNVDIVVDNHV